MSKIKDYKKMTMSVFFFNQKLVYVLLFITTIFLSSYEANAADQVILKYGILRESISVDELSTLAETGSISSSLRAYLRMAGKNPDDLQDLLNKKIDIDPVFLSKILNSFPGEKVLDVVSNVIKTPSGRASLESLRGALVTSALSDGNIKLIEILENYPTSELHIEGDRLADVYGKLKSVVEVMAEIMP